MSEDFISDKMRENLNKHIMFNQNVVDIIFRYPDRVLVYNHDLSKLNRFMGFGLDILYDEAIDILLENPDRLLKDYNDEFINRYIEPYYFKGWISFSDYPAKNHNLRILGSRDYYIPGHLAIELTDKCNLACKHCYREADHQGEFMDTKKLLTTVEKLAEMGLIIVELTGGEITLHPDFCKIVDYLAKKLDIVALLTNGYEYNQDIIDCIIRNKDKVMINVSLDSYRKEFHDGFRGRPGSWENACNLIKVLAEHDVRTRVAMAVIPENMFDIEKTISLAREMGVDNFAWDQVSQFGRGSSIDWNKVTQKEYYKYEKQSKYLFKEYYDMLTIIPAKIVKQMKVEGLNCGAGWRTFAIAPSGKLRLCVNSELDLFKIGNVFNEGINVFKKDILKDFAEVSMPRYRTCKNCSFYNFCNSCTLKGLIGAKQNKNCVWDGKKLADKINTCRSMNIHCVSKKTIAR